MRRILVTPRSLTSHPHPAIDALANSGFEVVLGPAGKQPDEADLMRLLPGCAGWLAGVEPVSPAVLAAAGQLRVISRNGVGTDNLPAEQIRERGIVVRTADGANAFGVAELAIGLMFAALRHIPAADAGIKAGTWPRRRGSEIRGRTVGVIGCGAVGREVVRLSEALGASVMAFDPMRPAGVGGMVFRWAEIPMILAEADIISLHCPPPRDGRALIGAAELASMRPGGVIINTARASLIDEAAFVAALDSGQLDVYASDVFAEEPPKSLQLAGHHGVIATSHIGAFTQESVDRATEMAVANLIDALGSDATTARSRAG